MLRAVGKDRPVIIMIIGILVLFVVVTSVHAAPKQKKNFFEGKTSIPNPIELRDPFKRPILKVKRQVYKKGGVSKKGRIFTNTKRVSSAPLSSIQVVGVLLGKERRAIVRLGKSGKETFMLREGMKLGPAQAELKAILPAGIVVVEKIKNIYNQEEYLETIIPVTD